jgi:hypothetical protein
MLLGLINRLRVASARTALATLHTASICSAVLRCKPATLVPSALFAQAGATQIMPLHPRMMSTPAACMQWALTMARG